MSKVGGGPRQRIRHELEPALEDGLTLLGGHMVYAAAFQASRADASYLLLQEAHGSYPLQVATYPPCIEMHQVHEFRVCLPHKALVENAI